MVCILGFMSEVIRAICRLQAAIQVASPVKTARPTPTSLSTAIDHNHSRQRILAI
ncbi:hypothetical protein BDW60DRAFT_192139, partial [Aspergillus nidulans var. acristatus]